MGDYRSVSEAVKMARKKLPIAKQKHPDNCFCKSCIRRLLAKHDQYLVEWIKSLQQRVDQLERDTSPHKDWI
jgi:DNA-dependent RNA polymerase auxiliary subunit epsilon